MKLKLAGVAVWIWIIGLVVIAAAGVIALPTIREAMKPPALEIVKKDLWRHGGHYEVTGQVFNPRRQAAKNVRLVFKIMESKLGRNDQLIEKQKGEATAMFEYLPPGATVEFIAVSDVQWQEYKVITTDAGKLSVAGE